MGLSCHKLLRGSTGTEVEVFEIVPSIIEKSPRNRCTQQGKGSELDISLNTALPLFPPLKFVPLPTEPVVAQRIDGASARHSSDPAQLIVPVVSPDRNLIPPRQEIPKETAELDSRSSRDTSTF